MSLEDNQLARLAPNYPILGTGTATDPFRSGGEEGRVLTLSEQYRAERKARLVRLGTILPDRAPEAPKPQKKSGPIIQDVRIYDPENYYRKMWFWDLVNFQPKPESRSYPQLKRIIHVVSLHYGVSIHEIVSARRDLGVALPRQVIMYLAKTLTVHSFPKIADSLGGRDHTTAMHGYRKIKKILERDERMKRTIEQLTSEICGP